MYRPGELIDNRYRVVRELGEGGAATVYLVEDTLANSAVRHALKLLHKTSEESVARFEREARVGLGINHRNIVQVRYIETAQGKAPYLTMEYVDGESLQDRIDRTGPVPFNEAIEILYYVSGALAFLHGNGIIHRDIKPGNILLGMSDTGKCTVKLSDLGLAKATTNEKTLTEMGKAVGTPLYMAAEQWGSGEVGPPRGCILACSYRLPHGCWKTAIFGGKDR